MLPKIFEVFGVDKNKQEGDAELAGDNILGSEPNKQETGSHYRRNNPPVEQADLPDVPPAVDIAVIAENAQQPQRHEQVQQSYHVSKLPKLLKPFLVFEDI